MKYELLVWQTHLLNAYLLNKTLRVGHLITTMTSSTAAFGSKGEREKSISGRQRSRS